MNNILNTALFTVNYFGERHINGSVRETEFVDWKTNLQRLMTPLFDY